MPTLAWVSGAGVPSQERDKITTQSPESSLRPTTSLSPSRAQNSQRAQDTEAEIQGYSQLLISARRKTHRYRAPSMEQALSSTFHMSAVAFVLIEAP